MARNYSNLAGAMALTAGVSAGSPTLALDTVVGLPATTPYTLVLDVGGASEEVVTVTGIVGLTVTVSRGQDGTTAASHSAGAIVRHMGTARDLREPAQHIDLNTGVHGVSGVVVGTSDSQTLTAKSMSGLTNTFTNLQKSSLPNTVVYTGDSQTLTNKTLDGASNTFTNVPKAALPATVVYTTDTQTLTNKTLTSPVITGGAISGASTTLTNVPADTALVNVVPKANLPTDTLYGANAGWVAGTAVFTAATGWSISGSLYRRIGDMVSIQINMSRTGATLVNGNINNTDMVTFTSGTLTPAQSNGHLGGGPSGPGFTAYAAAGGTITLTSVDSAISNGDTINVFGVYFL